MVLDCKLGHGSLGDRAGRYRTAVYDLQLLVRIKIAYGERVYTDKGLVHKGGAGRATVDESSCGNHPFIYTERAFYDQMLTWWQGEAPRGARCC